LDNEFNIFEGITQNWFFVGINVLISGLQILIIFVTGPVFKIAPQGQTGTMWAIAIVLGFISIPFGMIIRLIPDSLILRLVPDYLKRRAHRGTPGLTISDEYDFYPAELADVRDELAFLKRIKGGRLNNLKFAMRHPRETFMQRSRSPSHSRTSSVKMPATPTREDSFGSVAAAPSPGSDSRKRSKSMRSRSNSALGAPTVMAGIVAAGVAAGWSPVARQASNTEEGGEGNGSNNNSNNSSNLSEKAAEKAPEKGPGPSGEN
jgi:P-type Ca2+ transporter type 2C